MKFYTTPILTFMALLFLAGCNADGLMPEQQTHLNTALDFYAANKPDNAIEHCSILLQEDESSTKRGFLKARYVRAISKIRLGNYASARRDAESVVLAYQSSSRLMLPNTADDLEIKARDLLGEIEFHSGDLDSAKLHFEFVLKNLRQNKAPVDHAAYRMGCIAQREGQWNAADLYFQRVIKVGGSAPMVKDTHRRRFARAWSVQVGLYSAYSAALRAGNRFAASGWKTDVVSVSLTGRTAYALRVGRWTSRSGAQAEYQRIRALQSDAFITPTK